MEQTAVFPKVVFWSGLLLVAIVAYEWKHETDWTVSQHDSWLNI